MKEENGIQSFTTKFINQTNCNIFLTGRAGTGKTTFLKSVLNYTHKKAVVAAPTGVAAINAGGVTLHSLFQLPFGTFIPENRAFNSEISTQLSTPHSLRKNFQMNKQKRLLLQEIELLIIDEVSMLRADILDAIDFILRFVRRKNNMAFGGVQILFIGDLQQLPPVVKNDEKPFLNNYYESMYFFNARAFNETKLLYIEFEKIYRQADRVFIDILNHIRNNKLSENDIDLLNQFVKPGYMPGIKEGVINLTTHNYQADEINRKSLQKLPGESCFYTANVKGEFNEHQYPLDYELELKEGAQVMFIKNDYSGEQRYFNGKIGFVSSLDEETILVSFNDNTPDVEVEHYTWENKRFTLNSKNNEIEEKVVGTFSQFPLKLAWAITIHKSQGLTFEKAIIDVSKAFAPGQVYVALSRLTSLKGLILTKPVNPHLLSSDKKLEQFSENKTPNGELSQILENESGKYAVQSIKQAFSFAGLNYILNAHIAGYNKDLKNSEKQKHKSWAEALQVKFKPLIETANKFIAQVDHIANKNTPAVLSVFNERVTAAEGYFLTALDEIVEEISIHLKNIIARKKTKKYARELNELKNAFINRQEMIRKCSLLIIALMDKSDISKNTFQKVHKAANEKKKETRQGTKEISYNLYKEGKNITEISKIRNLAETTIEGHLAHYVKLGELDVKKFVQEEKLAEIIYVAQELDVLQLKPIKEKLGDEFSYSEIRFAVASIANV